MTSPVPTEPARGPHVSPHVEPALPPFAKAAAVAFSLALAPWLLFLALWLARPLQGLSGNAQDVAIVMSLLIFVGGTIGGIVLGGQTLKRLRAIPEDARPRGLNMAIAARTTGIATLVAFVAYTCFGMTIMRGRQLRRRGKVRLAPLQHGESWSRVGGVDAFAPHSLAAPAQAADAWRHNAQTEHASVAAFSHAALDLMAVGAAADLIARCHADALDEVRHTALCFAVARAIDGQSEEPAPFPAASKRPALKPGLARVASEALIEGALLEGAAANVARALASRCADVRVARVLATIAADEARHAAHGQEVVAWCLAAAELRGEREALEAALHAALAAVPVSPDADPDATAELEPFGIPSSDTLRSAYASAHRQTRALLSDLVCARGAA